jgi:hypothetical protein
MRYEKGHPECEQNALFKNCVTCHSHKDYGGVIEKMGGAKEKAFIRETFGVFDPDFEGKNCSGCHVSACTDCHEGKKKRPEMSACIKCHNGGKTGIDYMGFGVREVHERYQRGPEVDGKKYMKMLPDVHYEKGLDCGACHTMASLMGKEKAKSCENCHEYDKSITDHKITGHDKLSCVSCHAAWSANEYGVYYIRFRNSRKIDYFRWLKRLNDEYVTSSFMNHNSSPHLAKKDGVYMPVRPRIIFATNVYNDLPVGWENSMLSGRWEVFTPHTVRKETPTCETCHSDRRKYLLELPEDRIFLLEKDGLPIGSFYDSRYFTINGGDFVTEDDFKKISAKTNEYVKYYFEKLQQMKRVIEDANEF